MKKILVIAALLTCGMLTAADNPAPVMPTISLPATVQAKQGRLIRLQATTAQQNVKWFINDPDSADLIPILAEKAAIFCSDVPGVYRVFAYTAAGDQPSEPAVAVITVAGTQPPPPPPGPGPGPNPPPPNPQPVSGALWFIGVDDASTRTAATGKLLGDVVFWRGLASRKVNYGFYDLSSPVVTQKGYNKTGESSPYYIILGEDGTLLKHGPLPPDQAGVNAILKELGR